MGEFLQNNSSRVVYNTLADLLKCRTVFLGIGNRERGDDGFGPLLIEKIKNHPGFKCIDAGNTPENYIEVVVRYNPECVIIVDAVVYNRKPGEIFILDSDRLTCASLNVHCASLALVAEYLKKRCKCNVFILGVEPMSIIEGIGLSDPVSESVIRLGEFLLNFRT